MWFQAKPNEMTCRTGIEARGLNSYRSTPTAPILSEAANPPPQAAQEPSSLEEDGGSHPLPSLAPGNSHRGKSHCLAYQETVSRLDSFGTEKKNEKREKTYFPPSLPDVYIHIFNKGFPSCLVSHCPESAAAWGQVYFKENLLLFPVDLLRYLAPYQKIFFRARSVLFMSELPCLQMSDQPVSCLL